MLTSSDVCDFDALTIWANQFLSASRNISHNSALVFVVLVMVMVIMVVMVIVVIVMVVMVIRANQLFITSGNICDNEAFVVMMVVVAVVIRADDLCMAGSDVSH